MKTFKEWKEHAEEFPWKDVFLYHVVNDWQHDRENLIKIAEDFKSLIDHAERDPFATGNVHMGMDEGSVKGWELFDEICKKLEEAKSEKDKS